MSDRRLDTAEERISELEIDQKKLSRMQPGYTEGSLRDMNDTVYVGLEPQRGERVG